jgi:hypothetical protein
VIPHDDGLAVGMYGDVLTKPGTTHYVFHESLEQFWVRYRDDGDLRGTIPTNADYDQAVRRALEAVGYSPKEVSYLADRAAAQRGEYKLLDSDRVPEVPKKIRRAKTASQRLQERLNE